MSSIALAPTQHDPIVVAASLALAVLASYVSLDLARRVRAHDRVLARVWWAGGSFTMGTAIWATHFVGMLGFDAGMPLGYREGATLLSWLAAVAAAAVALGVASRAQLTRGLLALGSLAMAGGIAGMHYVGMAALDMAPGLLWRPGLVAASVLIALGASATALKLFFGVRRLHGARRLGLQSAAAVVMGLAIGGMHYTGMAAVEVPLGSVCLSAGRLGGSSLGLIVAAASATMLMLALLGSMHDAQFQRREARLARSLRDSNDQLRQANVRLQSIAHVDPLTGLPNRQRFEQMLREATARVGAGPDPHELAVLFVDLDGFKPVNDSWGHARGDQVLTEVARRLVGAAGRCGAHDMARIGGDEFVLLLEAPTVHAAAVALAETVQRALERPYSVGEQAVTLSCSVGIALFPGPEPAERLLACADAAMYAAKRKGGSGWAVFEPAMDTHAREQVALQEDLRHAVARGELSLHYQPQLCLATGRLLGVEALLRWKHPQRGMVSPALFVPVAERFGLIGMIGNWVIDEACAQLARWNAMGFTFHVAINVSAHQLRQADLCERIGHAIAHHGLAPQQLLCEITESSLVENMASSAGLLAGLVALGVTVSIDDFGTGYSSLAYLRQLPARELKIDRSLVRDVAESPEARAIVQAVVQLGHALGMQVLAEGVETAAEAEVLTQLHCDRVQGYLMARPMPPDALQAWAREHAPRAGSPGPASAPGPSVASSAATAELATAADASATQPQAETAAA